MQYRKLVSILVLMDSGREDSVIFFLQNRFFVSILVLMDSGREERFYKSTEIMNTMFQSLF